MRLVHIQHSLTVTRCCVEIELIVSLGPGRYTIDVLGILLSFLREWEKIIIGQMITSHLDNLFKITFCGRIIPFAHGKLGKEHISRGLVETSPVRGIVGHVVKVRNSLREILYHPPIVLFLRRSLLIGDVVKFLRVKCHMKCSEKIVKHVHCHATKSLGLGDHLVLLCLGDSRSVLDRIYDLSQTGSILDYLESLHPVFGIKSPFEVSDVVTRGRIAALVSSIEIKTKVTDLAD